MKEAIINDKNHKGDAPTKIIDVIKPVLPTDEGEYKVIPISEIDFSPLNYRKYYSEQALKDFAAEIKQHGIIQPVRVRRMPSGRYELVAGERRMRAAVIAGLTEIPTVISKLTDEQVNEIQLAENLQREDAHPLDEARGIALMQQRKLSIEEIAAILGKSKAFVYARIKLLTLIPSFGEMCYAGKINIQEALDIATLAPDAQTELFEAECKKWKSQKHFEFSNLEYLLRRYRYDLSRAPFDRKDKELLPEMGACNGCAFNSATLKLLFPEYAKTAICSNKNCYQQKCKANLVLQFTNAFQEHLPEALLFFGGPTQEFTSILEALPEAAELKQYNYHDVQVIKLPEVPDKEDFTYEDDDDQKAFDEEGYDQAVEEYNADLDAFQQQVDNKNILTGLMIAGATMQMVQFNPDKKAVQKVSGTVTSKQVQEAIKNKTATPDLLQAEIDRIKDREKRAKELDTEKVLLATHEQFTKETDATGAVSKMKLTADDQIAARLIIYQSLAYSVRHQVDEVLFGKKESVLNSNEKLYQRLANLSNGEFSYLIRQALMVKSESKYPTQVAGYALLQVAKASGTDVAGIQKAQNTKAETRQEKLKQRINDLQKRMKHAKAAA